MERSRRARSSSSRLRAQWPPCRCRAQSASLWPSCRARGRLEEARFEWRGEIQAPSGFAARAKFIDLGAAPSGALPGFARISGSFDADDTGARVVLATRKGELSLPRVFAQPRIELDFLNGLVEWERAGDQGFSLRFTSLTFSNPHLSGNAHGRYTSVPGTPGIIDLAAQFNRVDAAELDRYLPHAALMGGEALRGWLTRGVLAGRSSDVRVRLRGDLRDFPFTDPARGEFSVAARLERGVLHYAEGWPRIEAIQGELLFERDAFRLSARSARTEGVALSSVEASIPRLKEAGRSLNVTGQAEGPSADFLSYIQVSPVRRAHRGFYRADARERPRRASPQPRDTARRAGEHPGRGSVRIQRQRDRGSSAASRDRVGRRQARFYRVDADLERRARPAFRRTSEHPWRDAARWRRADRGQGRGPSAVFRPSVAKASERPRGVHGDGAARQGPRPNRGAFAAAGRSEHSAGAACQARCRQSAVSARASRRRTCQGKARHRGRRGVCRQPYGDRARPDARDVAQASCERGYAGVRLAAGPRRRQVGAAVRRRAAGRGGGFRRARRRARSLRQALARRGGARRGRRGRLECDPCVARSGGRACVPRLGRRQARCAPDALSHAGGLPRRARARDAAAEGSAGDGSRRRAFHAARQGARPHRDPRSARRRQLAHRKARHGKRRGNACGPGRMAKRRAHANAARRRARRGRFGPVPCARRLPGSRQRRESEAQGRASPGTAIRARSTMRV